MSEFNRRKFVKNASVITAGLGLALDSRSVLKEIKKEPLFEISLAEWSLNRSLFSKKMDNLVGSTWASPPGGRCR